MIRLTKALSAWGLPEFTAILTDEIKQLPAAQLPLQQGLAHSSYVSDDPFDVMIIDVQNVSDSIRVKAGIFFTGIIAGCNCADDPSPVESQTEYCTLAITIDKATAGTTIVLLPD